MPFPPQVRGPFQLDSEGNPLKHHAKMAVRHTAKISSEGFLGDDKSKELSGYEHEVGYIAIRSCMYFFTIS